MIISPRNRTFMNTTKASLFNKDLPPTPFINTNRKDA